MPERILPADIPAAIESGFIRYLGPSRAGHPVIWCTMDNWAPDTYSVEEETRYVAYILVQLARLHRAQGLGTKFTLLADVSGWAFWHVKYLSHIQAMVDVLQNQFPYLFDRVRLATAPALC